MSCAQRDCLLAEYKRRVKLYGEAVASLHHIRGCELPAEYKIRWSLASDALTACTSAQRQLGRHVVTHGCDMRAVDREKALSA
jgi:hypothetical protein